MYRRKSKHSFAKSSSPSGGKVISVSGSFDAKFAHARQHAARRWGSVYLAIGTEETRCSRSMEVR